MKTPKHSIVALSLAIALQTSTAQAAAPSGMPPPQPVVVIPHFIVQNNAPVPTGAEVRTASGKTFHSDVYPNGTVSGGYDHHGTGFSASTGPGNTSVEGHITIRFP